MEYALKYQKNLKGLLVANMMASAPEYVKYAEVLAKQMKPEISAEIRAIEAKRIIPTPLYRITVPQLLFTTHLSSSGVAGRIKPFS